MPTCTPPVAVREGGESYGVEIVLPVIGDENRVAGMVLDPGGEPVPLAALEHMTRSLVNKLLHSPVAKLRAETDREEGIATLEAARTLFGLDDPPEPDEGGDDDG